MLRVSSVTVHKPCKCMCVLMDDMYWPELGKVTVYKYVWASLPNCTVSSEQTKLTWTLLYFTISHSCALFSCSDACTIAFLHLGSEILWFSLSLFVFFSFIYLLSPDLRPALFPAFSISLIFSFVFAFFCFSITSLTGSGLTCSSRPSSRFDCKKKKAAFLLTKWQQREKLLSINVTQQVQIIKDGCGPGGRASHPPVRRAAFWSLTPLLWLLKCPWARFWTLDYPRSIHWSICVCLMLEKLFKA